MDARSAAVGELAKCAWFASARTSSGEADGCARARAQHTGTRALGGALNGFDWEAGSTRHELLRDQPSCCITKLERQQRKTFTVLIPEK